MSGKSVRYTRQHLSLLTALLIGTPSLATVNIDSTAHSLNYHHTPAGECVVACSQMLTEREQAEQRMSNQGDEVDANDRGDSTMWYNWLQVIYTIVCICKDGEWGHCNLAVSGHWI